MSIRAGSIVTVAGRNVVDRLQSAGLGDARIPIETIREIGNDLVVDKIPGEPDFTFSMESWDVSTDLMAFLHGAIGNQLVTEPPGFGDAAQTAYNWESCEFVNITSPWKSNVGSAGGNIGGGLIIPGYYPTRLRYRFGVTDNAVQEVELAGGSFYYAKYAPVEEVSVAGGAAYVTSEAARALRVGGPAATVYQRVFGVLLDGVLQVRNVDYVESTAAVGAAAGVATITFTVAPGVGQQVRFTYFTDVAKALPQAVNADATVKPGAVRGRNIIIRLDPDGVDARLPGVQTMELEATVEGEVERELGNSEITGRTINGTDTTGTVTIRPKDIPGFFYMMELITGRVQTEVYDYFNQESVPVQIDIQNPKNTAEILKSLYIADGQFQPPGTPARVNAATDFSVTFNSVSGTFSEHKAGRL